MSIISACSPACFRFCFCIYIPVKYSLDKKCFDLINHSKMVGHQQKQQNAEIPNFSIKNNDQPTPVEFKNLTESAVSLYWMDFNDNKLNLYTRLEPMRRNEQGLKKKIYDSRPWLAKDDGTHRYVLINDKKYFNPPSSNLWMKRALGWMSLKWNQVILLKYLHVRFKMVFTASMSSQINESPLRSNIIRRKKWKSTNVFFCT